MFHSDEAWVGFFCCESLELECIVSHHTPICYSFELNLTQLSAKRKREDGEPDNK